MQYLTPTFISALVFVALFGSALLGMRLRRRLPDNHLCDKTKDAVRNAMGSVATMAALILALLVASTKEMYDKEKSEVIELSSKVIWLDQTLANIGPEARECRSILRDAVQSTLNSMWSEARTGPESDVPTPIWSRELPMAIQQLSPQNEAQATFKSQATETAAVLGQMRWLLFEQMESSVSTLLLIMMVFWMAITYASVGLFAIPNRTSVTAQFLAALAVAGALFLILELDQPFAGVLRIPSEPLANALEEISV